jgi:hypothetical protein
MMESTSKSGENPKSSGYAPVVRSVVSNAKFDVEKFDGQNNLLAARQNNLMDKNLFDGQNNLMDKI